MKKILFLILTILSFNFLYSQNISQRATTNVTVQDDRWKARYNAILPTYNDTTAANLKIGLDSCGALIFTYIGNTVWQRSCNPKRWVAAGSSGSTISSFNFNSDSTIIICFTDLHCDTIPFTNNVFITNSSISNTIHGDTLIQCTTTGNVTVCDTLIFGGLVGDTILNYYYLNDSTLVACGDTTVVCQGGNCEIQQVCDTLSVPTITHTVYQVGIQEYPSKVVELGIDWGGYNNPNLGLFSTWLNRDKVIHTFGSTLHKIGFPIWKPITETWSMQSADLNTDISTFLSSGAAATGVLGNNNRDRFRIGYINNVYSGGSPSPIIYNWGYMGDKMGYYVGNNIYGVASYGMAVDDIYAKWGGMFIHDHDTLNNNSITFLGGRPSLNNLLNPGNLPLANDSVLVDKRILTLNYDKSIRAYGYGSASAFLSFDTSANKPLAVDANGNHVRMSYWPGGGGAVNNANIGAGFRILKPAAQDIKTLFAGTGIAIDSATNTNGLTITNTAPGTTYTASNGVSLNTADFQLGGATSGSSLLTRNTFITNNGFNFTIDGTANTLLALNQTNGSAFYALDVTSATYGINVTSVSPALTAIISSGGASAIQAVGISGRGIVTSSTSSYGLESASTSGISAMFRISPSSTNTVVPVAEFYRNSQGNGGNGIGGSLDLFSATSTTTGQVLANQLIWKFTNATHASRTSQLDIIGVNSSVTGTIMSAYGSGVVGIGISSGYTATRLDVVDNSVGAASIVNISSTSTAAASNLQKGLNVDMSGANATNSQTTYGGYFSNTHTGGGVPTNYGIYAVASGGLFNYGVKGVSDDYIGVFGSTTTGTGISGDASTSGGGVVGTSSTGIGVRATTTGTGGLPFSATAVASSTNTVLNVARITRTTSGTAADGIGGSLRFDLQADDGSTVVSNTIISKLSTAAVGTATSQFIITGRTSNVAQDWVTLSSGGAVQFNQYGSGALTTDGSGNITATSDKRVKHDIRLMNFGLKEIMKVEPSTFIYNQDKTNTVMPGFIAQNIKEVFGGLGVGKDGNGMLTLNTNVVLGAVVNAEKELSKQLIEQQIVNKEQQSQIDELKKEIIKLNKNN